MSDNIIEYTTNRKTTVSRKAAKPLHKATFEIIPHEPDQPLVLIDGLVPYALALQFQALVTLSNAR